MGWGYRKRVKLLPGINLNIGKRGAGVSGGKRGARVSVKNARGITPLAAATFGSTAGRGRAAAPAGADSLGFEAPSELAHPSTVAMLKKLGATE